MREHAQGTGLLFQEGEEGREEGDQEVDRQEVDSEEDDRQEDHQAKESRAQAEVRAREAEGGEPFRRKRCTALVDVPMK